MTTTLTEERKALIITDDSEAAAALCSAFVRCRYHVETCTRLAEAANRALVENFACVVVDLDSQSIAPGEAVAILRQLIGEARIVCVGSDVSLERQRAVRTEGACTVFKKPVDPDEIQVELSAIEGRVS